MASTGQRAFVLPLLALFAASCGRARASAEGHNDAPPKVFGASIAHAAGVPGPAASALASTAEAKAEGAASAPADGAGVTSADGTVAALASADGAVAALASPVGAGALPASPVGAGALSASPVGAGAPTPVGELGAGVASIASAASSAGRAAGGEGGPCPDDMVLSGSACVDRYEAYLVQVNDAGGEARWPYYQRPRAGVAYAARNEAGASPQAYVSRNEADAACKRAGKRLCTFAEWGRACQGKRRGLYPYGGAYKRGACNSGKPHLLSMFFGRDGHSWKYEEHFNNPLLNQQPGFLAKAGEYGECESDEGAHDMVGNLHEWVADLVDEGLMRTHGGPPPRHHFTRLGNGIFMGGFFSTTDEHGAGCTFVTTAHEPAYHDYSLGFRCCRAAARR